MKVPRLDNENSREIFDVAIIGGGPAGMMAALTARQRGLSVVLLEKNSILGKKLLITGGGRCNVTNNKTNVRDILGQYKEAGKFLFSTFMQYSVTDTISFFAERGLEFKEENEGRMFPVTDSAKSVTDILVKELSILEVMTKTGFVVTDFKKNQDIFEVFPKVGQSVQSRSLVVATGGSSRPETGSSGDALPWLAASGHTVHNVSNALVPIMLKEKWVQSLGGVTLKDVKVTLYCGAKKQKTQTGKLLFTHFGLSGPLILNLSKTIGDLLVEDTVTLKIDLRPDLDDAELQAELLKLFVAGPNKKLKNVLSDVVTASLVAPILSMAGLDGLMVVNTVTAANRKKIGLFLKAFVVNVDSLLGEDKAVVSSGGVDLSEVDFKTMESKKIPGLYLVGDVLNINRPSGGYSLQLCWSTGAVAGFHV